MRTQSRRAFATTLVALGLASPGCVEEVPAPGPLPTTELQPGMYQYDREAPLHGGFTLERGGGVVGCLGYPRTRCAGTITAGEWTELTDALEVANALHRADAPARLPRGVLADPVSHTICTTTDELAHCFLYEDIPIVPELEAIVAADGRIVMRLLGEGACGPDTCPLR